MMLTTEPPQRLPGPYAAHLACYLLGRILPDADCESLFRYRDVKVNYGEYFHHVTVTIGHSFGDAFMTVGFVVSRGETSGWMVSYSHSISIDVPSRFVGPLRVWLCEGGIDQVHGRELLEDIRAITS